MKELTSVNGDKDLVLNEKIKELLIAKDLQPSKLADMLQVNRASISHVLSGRNKPGLEIVRKILEVFPELNPNWLLFDETNMYKEESTPEATKKEKEKNEILESILGKKIAGKSERSSSEKQIEKVMIIYSDKTFEVYHLNH
jgi:transcriptional regulator with XRE-family HTH domain